MSTNERNSVGEAGGGVGSGPGGRTPSQLSRTCHRATAQSTNFIRDLEATTTAMAKSLNHETWAKARPDAEEMLTHTKEHIMTATTTNISTYPSAHYVPENSTIVGLVSSPLCAQRHIRLMDRVHANANRNCLRTNTSDRCVKTTTNTKIIGH